MPSSSFGSPRFRLAFRLALVLGLGGSGAGCAGIHTVEPVAGAGASTGGAVGAGGDASTGTGGTARGGVLLGVGGASGRGQGVTCNPCTDLPASPIFDSGAPANSQALLGPSGGSGAAAPGSAAPCLLEPEDGSLFPRNWLRPRFRFTPAANQDLFELRLHVDNQANDLVVYTTATTWTMPKDLWKSLSVNATDRDIAVTVRGVARASAGAGTGAGPGASATVRIAPASADGTIVYWTTSGGSALKGFHVGDEGVTTVLTPSNASGQCVACHSSTPDGAFIGFSASPSVSGNSSHIEIRSGQNPAQQPTFLSASAQTLLARVQQQLPTFSRGHWTSGDHVLVVAESDTPGLPARTHLDWIDLEASSTAQGVGWGELARTGDPGAGPAHPFFSHDGQSLVYASSSGMINGGIVDHGDLYRIPFADRKGGAATPIQGASTAQWNEFYPALSSDDGLLAFTRAPDGQTSYDNAAAEIFVVKSAGGTPTRLRANDPVACLGRTSPGLTNSWPKWAPTAGSALGKTYHWLIFSSKRLDQAHPQLYMAAVVEDEFGFSTTPALYLWNQPAGENNHTPAWDVFQIPAVE